MAGGMHGGRHVWWGCMGVAGGMYSRGMGGCVAGGHVWQILRDKVNERAARMLLECILV